MSVVVGPCAAGFLEQPDHARRVGALLGFRYTGGVFVAAVVELDPADPGVCVLLCVRVCMYGSGFIWFHTCV
jgi:hypothetical protein